MATADHDSGTDFGIGPSPQHPGTGRPSGSEAAETIYLDGGVLACACPDCGAPMSIRLWLMVADCWRCGCSIELSEEQEREALRLLQEQEQAKEEEREEAAAAIQPTYGRKPPPERSEAQPTASPADAPPTAESETTEPKTSPPTKAPVEPGSKNAPKPPGAAVVGAPTPGRPTTQPRTAEHRHPGKSHSARERPSRSADGNRPKPAQPGSAPPPSLPGRRPASSRPSRVRERIARLGKEGTLGVWLNDLLKDLPAWLVSLVLHLVAMLLLGLWIVEPPEDDLSITLSTAESWQDLPGEIEELDPLTDEALEFDDPGAIRLEPVEAEPDTAGEAPIELPKPYVGGPDLAGDLPILSDEMMVDLPASEAGHMLSGRNPEIRSQLVRRSGGTTETEAAVSRGLKFLARHQNEDGSWSLNRFHQSPQCNGQCDGAGSLQSDMGATALALLPFLGAGQTHAEGEHAETVFRGLKWLVEHQSANGDLRGAGGGRMYAHAQAAIVLCEAYAISRDEQLHTPAQKALNFIVKAQHKEGGWRYQPNQPGDTSVVGWQLMALRSGQMGYLIVPEAVLTKVSAFLDSVQTDKLGGRYGYRPGHHPTPAMTAEALLCRQYLGWPKGHRGMRSGVRYLLREHPPQAERPNIYYWYYATQVMHHYGGSTWANWNRKMREALTSLQEDSGHAAGSWAPQGGHSRIGGRIYMTSLAICTLEVYYRHLPIYQTNAWRPEEPEE